MRDIYGQICELTFVCSLLLSVVHCVYLVLTHFSEILVHSSVFCGSAVCYQFLKPIFIFFVVKTFGLYLDSLVCKNGYCVFSILLILCAEYRDRL